MHCLRSSRRLARLVLMWFALAVGAAAASPLVQAPALTLVCTAGGLLKLVAIGQDPDAATGSSEMLDCALCVLAAAPPPDARLPVAPLAASTGPHWHLAPAERVRRAAPLPGRGPPVPAA